MLPPLSNIQHHDSDDHWDGLVECMNLLEWDALSEVVLQSLVRHIGRINGQNILEAGSGTGRISYKLARAGARVTLLDSSPKAIEVSRERFARSGTKAEFHQGSIFSLSFPDGSFDVVWNAALLEHFQPEEQAASLKEMTRVCKPGGLVITLNPNARALFYRFGKTVIEAFTEFPYGYEAPIRTLAPAARMVPLMKDLQEYSTGFFVIFIGGLEVCAMALGRPDWRGKGPLRFLNTMYLWLQTSLFQEIINRFDRALSRLIGGYLLVTSARKVTRS